MRSYARPSLLSGMPQAGPVTKWLCGLLVSASIAAAVSQRYFGFGSEMLVFDTASVMHWQLWRLITYVFVKTSFFGVMIGSVILWLFGSWCESTWGSRDYLRFFISSSIGAALLAIPLCYLGNLLPLPWEDLGRAEGPDAAINAMMVALALNAPTSNVLFGFVLPMPAKTVIWVIIGLDVASGLFNGVSTLSITLGGMIMGYFLVTGNWRPQHALNRLRMWRLRRRRRDGLYVVPPRNKNTLN